MPSNLVDLEGKKIDETELGIRLDIGGTVAWFPKRHVEDNGDGTFTMPEWLAIEKDVV